MTPPPVVTAHVWRVPADIALTPLARPETSTGTLRSVVVPSPSHPYMLLPQHLTPPALVSAQVELQPTVIAVTPLVGPTTSTGRLLSAFEPSPSLPYRLSPQHLTPPR